MCYVVFGCLYHQWVDSGNSKYTSSSWNSGGAQIIFEHLPALRGWCQEGNPAIKVLPNQYVDHFSAVMTSKEISRTMAPDVEVKMRKILNWKKRGFLVETRRLNSNLMRRFFARNCFNEVLCFFFYYVCSFMFVWCCAPVFVLRIWFNCISMWYEK